MKYRPHLAFVAVALLLIGCSGNSAQSPQVYDQLAVKTETLLTYGKPTIMANYHAKPDNVPFNYDHARIGIAKIHRGNFADLNTNGKRVTWHGYTGNIVYNGWHLEDHAAQINGWNRFMATGQQRTVMYITDPGLHSKYLEKYDKRMIPTDFAATLQYVQQSAAANQLDYIIIYESDMLKASEQATTAKALEGFVHNTPAVIGWPLGVAGVIATSPLPLSNDTSLGYTDAFVIHVPSRTYQEYRGLSLPKDTSKNALSLFVNKEQNMKEGAEIPIGLISESFQSFLGAIQAQ